MRCTVLSVCIIALVQVSLCEPGRTYVTTAQKNLDGYTPVQSESFSIPDGQCSGLIDESLLCESQAAGAVRVRARDGAGFPEVSVASSLRSAAVRRARGAGGRCAGAADVQLDLYCLRGARPRRRRALARLPPAPAHSLVRSQYE